MDSKELGQAESPQSIQTKFLVMLVLLFTLVLFISGIVSIIGLPFTSYDGWQGNTRRDAARNLNLVADLRKERLMLWLRERRGDVQVIAKNEIVASNLPHLLSLIHNSDRKSEQPSTYLERSKDEQSYLQIRSLLSSVKSAYSQNQTVVYDEIRIVDALTGTVVTSTNSNEVGTTYYEHKELEKIRFSRGVYISDVAQNTDFSAPYIQVAHRIVDQNNSVIGIASLEVSIMEILTSLLTVQNDLGKTGEILLVNEYGSTLTTLRFPLSDGTIAKVLDHQITAKPAVFAASGREGSIESADYRGHAVIAAYRHLRISPDWGWGMVVKIDQEQLFAPVKASNIFSLWIGLGGILLVIILTMILTRQLTQPLRHMTKVAARLASGDSSARTGITSHDEIGLLSSVFDQMADNIESSKQNLEKRIIERTLSLDKEIIERKETESVLRQSEARLQAIFDGIPDGIIFTNTSRNILAVNRGMEKTFGYTLSDLKGESASILYETEEEYRNQDQRQYNLTVISRLKPYEVRYRHKNGKFFFGETIGSSITDINGETIGYIEIARDITERKHLEEQVRRSQKMDAVGQLTGGIAHDFNNILGIIIGNINLLECQYQKDKTIQKRTSTIKKAADRATNLTKQLLSFSRRQPAKTSRVNINKVIVGMDNLIARSITPQVEVTFSLANEVWLTEIDSGDFEDALLNLVINARDAMPGGGQLTVKTNNSDIDAVFCEQNQGIPPGEYVQLSVSDDGDGISDEQIEHIFEPFFTTKPQGKGTGLGLAMVFGFVKRSGGYIKAYSELNIGTTFKLYIPRTKGQEQQEKLDNNSLGMLPKGAEAILVVDDEMGLLTLAQEALEGLGYRVITATDGNQALDRLVEEPNIALLFSDVVMPGGINGYDLAEQATVNRPDLKVLLTSGYLGEITIYKRQEQFSEGLLSKPYSFQELALAVGTLLGNANISE